jgi:hypothetical protein
MRTLRFACLLAGALALVLGTAVGAEAKRRPVPKGGVWSGSTSQRFGIDFRVSPGRRRKAVVSLTADFRLRCSDGKAIERNLSTRDRAPVARGKFAIVLNLVPNDLIKGGTAKFVGSFKSGRRVRGRARERLRLRDGRTCDSKRVRWRAKFRRR